MEDFLVLNSLNGVHRLYFQFNAAMHTYGLSISICTSINEESNWLTWWLPSCTRTPFYNCDTKGSESISTSWNIQGTIPLLPGIDNLASNTEVTRLACHACPRERWLFCYLHTFAGGTLTGQSKNDFWNVRTVSCCIAVKREKYASTSNI